MSDLEEIRLMLHYMKTLDPINAKILEGLGKYGPRNISFLAKSIGLPHSTVAFRVKKLMKESKLEIFAHLDWNKLGLMKAVVIAYALPGRWNTLWKAFENLSYLTYMARCYAKFHGCYAIFAFPVEYQNDFEDYLDKAMRLQVLSHYLLFWITNPCEVYPNFYWFDFKKRAWNFQWKQWVEEILNASEHLSQRLMDPKACPIMVDEKDLIILRELEQNGMIGFDKLAEVVGITPQSVAYRYYEHIVERKLIIDYDVGIFLYPYEASDLCSFIIEFEDEKALAKFTNCLNDKPFMLSYARVIGQNSLVAHTYTPKLEMPNLIESLDRLAEMNLIKSFFHVTLDVILYKDSPLPCELFEQGTWHYNLQENLQQLNKIAKIQK